MEEIILKMLADICGDEIVMEDADINLLENDLMDSLDYTELLVGIEEKLGVIIAPSELTREEMKTPNRIISQVKARM
ncbi:MAG: D-alanine--poly(phosphoribitol) ligase subunit 2 [Bacillota bacterium]|nr:D-alanine--poly(phosphoribitol) ligase subunit 2 [Bacillota bacterium]